MKKIVFIILGIAMMLGGCESYINDSEKSESGAIGEKEKDETNSTEKFIIADEEIIADIEKQEEFKLNSVKVKKMNVIKRQTNLSDKEDIIFVNVIAENEDFLVVRNYRMFYVLYNEGWILEEIENYEDEEHYNEINPLHPVEREDVEAAFKELTNYNPNEYFLTQLKDVTVGEIEKIFEETNSVTYRQRIVYDYELFQDVVTITVNFYIDGIAWGSETQYSIIPYLKKETAGIWYTSIECGWEMYKGLYLGGNNAYGGIEVKLYHENEGVVWCEIEQDIHTKRYETNVGSHSRTGYIEATYLYNDEGYLSGLVLMDAKRTFEERLILTLDGIYYGTDEFNWKLEKK